MQFSVAMRSWLALVVAVVLLQGVTAAHAAGPAGRAPRAPRLGVFKGLRVNNTFIEGKAEAPLTTATDVRIKAKGGRLYVTMTPPGCQSSRCWVQSFKIVSDDYSPGVSRMIQYQRDTSPRVQRFNESVFAKLWGPGARLVDMTGSGTLLLDDDGHHVRWINVGKGTMLVSETTRDGVREVPGQTSWSETFHGRRPERGTAGTRARPLAP